MSPGHNMGLVLRKGAWTAQEDMLLKNHIQKYGEGKWNLVPLKAGLNRCGKSCRLRWLNYLKPDIKRGDFEEDEVDLILRLHKLLGNRWSLIAGRIPGRTANDVKNYWNTHVRSRPKRQKDELKDGEQPQQAMVSVIRPQPRTLSKTLNMYPGIEAHDAGNFETLSNDGFSNAFNISQGLASAPRVFENKINEYVDELFVDFGKEKDNEVGWTMRGVTLEEKGLDVDEQEDGLNSLFDFPMDDGI